MKTFFTSDTHFGHARIIELSKRPFANVDEMNEAIIQRWNAVVGPGDTVYHLGDAFMGPPETVQLRKRLNGKIILVKGNHDKKDAVLLGAGVDEIHRRLEIELDGYKLYLAHIPKHLPDPTARQYPAELMQDLPASYDYFLCGHVHGQWKRQGKTINVGVDVSNFTPMTLEQLLVRDAVVLTAEEAEKVRLGLVTAMGFEGAPDLATKTERKVMDEALTLLNR